MDEAINIDEIAAEARNAAPGEDLFLKLTAFEGPIDLLLALAREQKVDLAQISVLALAEHQGLTGRAVVDDAEILVTTVVGGKRLPDGRRAAILDAGVNLLFTAFWYNHEVKPLRPLDGIAEETVLYGPLCMNIDLVRASIMLPPLNVGEPLIIRPAGAYNNTQWMQFIQYRPAVVMVTEAGRVELIRAAEHLETITELEAMPPTLADPFPKGLPE